MSILGLLKFSSFEKGSNGETYFEQLKQGKVHFSKPFDFTSENLSRAQQALEGSTNFVKLNNNCRESGPTFNCLGNYIKSSYCGMKFGDIKNIYYENFSISPEKNDSDNLKKINQKLKKVIESEKNKKRFDIIAYPHHFKKNKNCFTFNSIKFEFLNVNDNATWHLASFTSIDSKPDAKFISDLLDHGGPKGSIAYNNDGEFRSWVFIPYAEFKRCISQFNGLTYGKVSYYTENTYPYNTDDIILSPNKLLFAKDSNYKSQNEFRIIYGGPNESFKTNYTELINFNWPKESISYGTTKESLLDTLNLL